VINGKKPDSEYKKIPVVIANNIQINDSYFVVKSFARILDGEELSAELLALEDMTTYGLIAALEAEVAGSFLDLEKCAFTMGGGYGFLLASMACCICCCGRSMFRNRHPDLRDLEYYRQVYAKALGTDDFFHGLKPGVVDLSICGVLAPFVFAGNFAVDKFLGTSGKVFDWYQRMKPILPKVF